VENGVDIDAGLACSSCSRWCSANCTGAEDAHAVPRMHGLRADLGRRYLAGIEAAAQSGVDRSLQPRMLIVRVARRAEVSRPAQVHSQALRQALHAFIEL
jgi:hypothetical protein